MDEVPPGTLLAGRFAVDGPPLGAGASGVVYGAVDAATGRRVAAKVLHAAASADRAALERLQAEAAIAGRLRHPHVVEVVGLWSDRGDADAGGTGRWVLVSEFVDGLALDQVGALPPAAVVELGLELVDGLDAAAKLGLVHGDVRPGNVMVGPSGGAQLFDFGVARLATEATPLRPGETAPERLDGGPPTEASDVYGLGIVLHHALNGRLPWAGDTPWAVIGAQRSALARSAVSGPRGLAALIAAMLHPDPVERPDLAMVRAALTHLRGRPDRRMRLRRPVPSIRPGAPWAVHGIDPVTGAPAVIRTGLSRRQAKALLAHLRAEGWQVRGVRSAFGWKDLAWISAGTLLGGVAVPVIGAVPAGWLAVRWRAQGIRAAVERSLPQVVGKLPPRPASGASGVAVLIGLMLLVTAGALAWWPPLAVAPAALVALLAVWAIRPARAEPDQLARQGRVQSAFAELRALLDPQSARTPALLGEDMLGMAGEVDALEADWASGRLDVDRVLIRVEDLSRRVAAEPAARDLAPAAALDALRRAPERS